MNLDQALIAKMIKFGVVGSSGVVVDFIITYLLKEKLRLNKYLASSVGLYISATSNYFFNRIWTFENTNPNWLPQYLTFLAVSLGGVSISLGITYILNEKFKINFYLAKAISIGGAMIWNFLLNYLITFAGN
jgi:putative flippase GtrA